MAVRSDHRPSKPQPSGDARCEEPDHQGHGEEERRSRHIERSSSDCDGTQRKERRRCTADQQQATEAHRQTRIPACHERAATGPRLRFCGPHPVLHAFRLRQIV